MTMHKYNAKKVTYDGFTFDSTAEYERYLQLKAEEAKDEISSLSVHPRFELIPAFIKKGKTEKEISPIFYEADFSYLRNEEEIVEDVKGFETDEFKILEKLFEYTQPVQLSVIKQYHGEFMSREQYEKEKKEKLLELREKRKELKKEAQLWNKTVEPEYQVNPQLLLSSGSTYKHVRSDIRRIREETEGKKKAYKKAMKLKENKNAKEEEKGR